MLCLANSRKLSGRCAAGITREGEWIRPVSADDDGTLYRRHYLLDSGDEAKVMDVIKVQLGAHVPERHQPENWRVGDARWHCTGHLAGDGARRFLRQHCAQGPELLGTRSDRVSWEELGNAPAVASLALVRPENVRWYIKTSYYGNRQARALFSVGGEGYDLSITDPIWEARLGELAYGVHEIEAGGVSYADGVFLTISLSEPLPNGYCFKLIASVITIP